MNAARFLTVAFFAITSLFRALPAPAKEAASPAPPEIQGLKSEHTATMRSLLGTTIPIVAGTALGLSESKAAAAAPVLILGGYMFGPSLGHFYAGRPGAAWRGIGLRALPWVGLGAASAMTWNSSGNSGEKALAIGSAAIGAWLVIGDISRASQSARNHNRELGQVSIRGASVVGAPGMRVTLSM